MCCENHLETRISFCMRSSLDDGTKETSHILPLLFLDPSSSVLMACFGSVLVSPGDLHDAYGWIRVLQIPEVPSPTCAVVEACSSRGRPNTCETIRRKLGHSLEKPRVAAREDAVRAARTTVAKPQVGSARAEAKIHAVAPVGPPIPRLNASTQRRELSLVGGHQRSLRRGHLHWAWLCAPLPRMAQRRRWTALWRSAAKNSSTSMLAMLPCRRGPRLWA